MCSPLFVASFSLIAPLFLHYSFGPLTGGFLAILGMGRFYFIGVRDENHAVTKYSSYSERKIPAGIVVCIFHIFSKILILRINYSSLSKA